MDWNITYVYACKLNYKLATALLLSSKGIFFALLKSKFCLNDSTIY